MSVNPMQNIQRAHAAPRCRAKSKRTTGQRCKAPAVRGFRVCRMHGARGGAPEGERNGNYRHGARSKETIALWKLIKSMKRKCSAPPFGKIELQRTPKRREITPRRRGPRIYAQWGDVIRDWEGAMSTCADYRIALWGRVTHNTNTVHIGSGFILLGGDRKIAGPFGTRTLRQGIVSGRSLRANTRFAILTCDSLKPAGIPAPRHDPPPKGYRNEGNQ
jgi:hypothetical protein